MTTSLADRFGFSPRELVSIVGAGGKTTLLRTLGHELARDGHRVILTTTTRMAADQVTEPVCWSPAPADVTKVLRPGAPLFVMSAVGPDKAVGLGPDTVDRLFTDTSADFVLVEADGARSMSIKAPAVHEPVIPGHSTTVIVVVGADALGEPLVEVAHRPERIARLTGRSVDSIVTAEIAAAVLLHPDGGLKNIPDGARTVMAITKPPVDSDEAAQQLATLLMNSTVVDRVVAVPAGVVR